MSERDLSDALAGIIRHVARQPYDTQGKLILKHELMHMGVPFENTLDASFACARGALTSIPLDGRLNVQSSPGMMMEYIWCPDEAAIKIVNQERHARFMPPYSKGEIEEMRQRWEL